MLWIENRFNDEFFVSLEPIVFNDLKFLQSMLSEFDP